MTHYRMKAEGYHSVAKAPGAASPQSEVSPAEWQQAAANLGSQPAGLSAAEWNLRLYAEVRRLRAAEGDRK